MTARPDLEAPAKVEATVSGPDKLQPISFEVTRRFPFSRYRGLASLLLGLVGLAIPGKRWKELLSKIPVP